MIRIALRRIWLGLLTLLGCKRGYFIPYRWAHTLDPDAQRAAAQHTQSKLAASHHNFITISQHLAELAPRFAQIGAEAAPQPRWAQDWFSPLDAAVLYALVTSTKPKTILEIGSGHSTRFSHRAIIDGDLPSQIIAIDPAPRADISRMQNVTLHKMPLSLTHEPMLRTLEPDDILFIDSSHILMPGTDVDLLFNRFIWQIPRGVLIHIHDIFLPDPYPKSWEWRGYNEQNILGSILQHHNCEILWASNYIKTTHPQLIALDDHIMRQSNNPPSSLWLRFMAD